MPNKVSIDQKHYKWDIKSGDYMPELDEGYKKYKKKNKNIKQIFALFAIAIIVSSIIILFISK